MHIAELEALDPAYETALLRNGVDTLTDFFWNSPLAVRFGITKSPLPEGLANRLRPRFYSSLTLLQAPDARFPDASFPGRSPS